MMNFFYLSKKQILATQIRLQIPQRALIKDHEFQSELCKIKYKLQTRTHRHAKSQYMINQTILHVFPSLRVPW